MRSRGKPQKKDPIKIMEEAVSASAVVEHSICCPQTDNQINVSILKDEQDLKIRKIKEAFYIRHNVFINRDEGTEESQKENSPGFSEKAIVWQETGCPVNIEKEKTNTTVSIQEAKNQESSKQGKKECF
uniref:Uncharacterized protein n=1 Tax=Trichuris muris TaxID=70415 RepID=A0A5S6QC83_TRIMR